MLLSDDEIQSLTGYIRAADQRRWLDRNGYRYALGARGKPKVARDEAMRHLVGSDATHAITEPDWKHLP
ncbi:hypothetical protein J2T57_002813 [Natronocella acetinitrilica]|uniref:DUF4224 domain-containing protein n=1 Tax=Natronocella acetinitrilica TaxID=414046 RepID=A0AAE3KCZ8_9GAMM|nr:hypothetical protein [Natronocella acetinitrilica]